MIVEKAYYNLLFLIVIILIGGLWIIDSVV